MTPALQPLPIGIQDFAQLRERGCLYVDKTELVHRLVTTSSAVFLSRPRRFGKSLLISVFQNLYEGRRDLFEGLWIEDKWNWTKIHPVVRISFGTGKFQERGAFRDLAWEQLFAVAQQHQVDIAGLRFDVAFSRILREISARGPRPVVLIDEYDKPILQCLEGMRDPFDSAQGTPSGKFLEAREEELSVLEENRQDLRAFYSCLKDASPEFLFLTGVSRLAKASVFSELNHLDDITWQANYATVCGITQTELERDFAPHLEAMAEVKGLSPDDLLARIRRDYNGFRFAAGDRATTVYNPFSTCKALQTQEFGNYWTETGTPEFLVRMMHGTGVELADVEGRQLAISGLSSLDPDRPDVLPLLLQTGYLTITGWDQEDFYRLGFPNKEVRVAFVEHLLRVIHDKRTQDIAPRALALAKALHCGDLDLFISEMQGVFTGIAYQLDDAHEKRYHGLFHALCILAFSGKGLVLSEVPNALGRSDLVIDLPDVCWIFEFKRDTDTAKALEQTKHKRYENQWEGRPSTPLREQPWDGTTKSVRMAAVTFGTSARNIVSWELGA
jgi:Predicted AAA-ATPase/PD-(D/E)XK nuclease superfamily